MAGGKSCREINEPCIPEGRTFTIWAIIYFWARVIHYAGFMSGLPFVRTLSFAVGWLATMIIFLQIIT